jgi:hypothetical protein
MAKYKFDGTYLKEGSTVLANVKGNEIREGRGTTVIGNIKGDEIRQKHGTTIMFNIKGDEIRQGNSTSKIATMKDVDKEIDGPGKVVKAALWLLCCR